MVLIFYGNLKEILIKWSFAIWIWKQGRREDVTFGGGGGGLYKKLCLYQFVVIVNT
jgi:hypothetical protein